MFAVADLKTRKIVGVYEKKEDVLAVLDALRGANLRVAEVSSEFADLWKSEPGKATSILMSKFEAYFIALGVKNLPESEYDPSVVGRRFRRVIERVVFLLEKNPELRSKTRAEQVQAYEAVFGPAKGADTVRRTFAKIQNTLGLYQGDEKSSLFRMWNEEQYRQAFGTMESQEFEYYAENAGEVARTSVVDLVRQALSGKDYLSVEEEGDSVVVRKAKYIPGAEFTRLTNVLRSFGFRWDRELGAWVRHFYPNINSPAQKRASL